MPLSFYVEEGALGWRVRHGASYLVEGLPLGKAIKFARQLARDHHEQTGYAVKAELVIPEKILLLAKYASQAVVGGHQCDRTPAITPVGG